MSQEVVIIKGGIAKDHRGQIRFINDFDMSPVKRFYIIRNIDVLTIRGWRAHRIEQRWFSVVSGSFRINIVKIDDWDSPSKDLPIKKIILSESSVEVLHVPAGYGMMFQALNENSELIVFANYGIDHVKNDDYTYDLTYFKSSNS